MRIQVARACAALLLAACGGAPPPKAESLAPSQRDVTLQLEADAGDARVLVDGRERLRSTGRGNTLALDLVEGDHPVVVRGVPAEYGGMGIELRLVEAGKPIVQLSCARPCDAGKLSARVAALQRGESSDPCAGVAARELVAETREAGDFEVRFVLAVAPRGAAPAAGCR